MPNCTLCIFFRDLCDFAVKKTRKSLCRDLLKSQIVFAAARWSYSLGKKLRPHERLDKIISTAKAPRSQSFWRREFFFKKEFKPLRFPSRSPRLCGKKIRKSLCRDLLKHALFRSFRASVFKFIFKPSPSRTGLWYRGPSALFASLKQNINCAHWVKFSVFAGKDKKSPSELIRWGLYHCTIYFLFRKKRSYKTPKATSRQLNNSI